MQDEIRTGPFDVVANDDTTAIFSAMTPAMSTADLASVRFGVWLSGLTEGGGLVKVKVGVQFSNDGITWDSPSSISIGGASWVSARGWTFNSSWTDLTSLGGGSTYRLFVRFGAMAVNSTASDTATRGAQVELSIQARPKTAGTLTVGPVRAWCTGPTAIFIPMTDWINAEDVGEIRGSVELLATSGDLGLTCAWRQADTPTVVSDWSSATEFGNEADANEIAYGTTFSTPSITKKYVQFGVNARNTNAAAVVEAGQATIRVDYRNL